MFTLLTTLSLLIINPFISINPEASVDECCPIVFSTNEINLNFDPLKYKLYIKDIYDDTAPGKILVETKAHINEIMIVLKSGKKIMMPVHDSKVYLDKNVFQEQDATIYFAFENANKTFDVYTEYKKK